MLLSRGLRIFMANPEPFINATRLTITLVYSPGPRQVRQWAIELETGATVAEALATSSLFKEFPELQTNRLLAGIWGRGARLNHVLADNDRVEVYRSLRVDPKTARRERFDSQGAKSAGLFTKKRPGAKAGY